MKGLKINEQANDKVMNVYISYLSYQHNNKEIDVIDKKIDDLKNKLQLYKITDIDDKLKDCYLERAELIIDRDSDKMTILNNKDIAYKLGLISKR